MNQASRTTDMKLWASVLLGPLAAGIHTIIGYTSAHYSCDMNYKKNLFFVTASSLLLCALGIYLAWSTRAVARSESDELPGAGRQQFMMYAGLSLSAGCALFTLAGLLAILILHPCD